MTATNPLFQNLSQEHGFRPLRLEGSLPENLSGTMYRAGPGLFERFDRRVAHPFEADGAVSAVRLGNDQAEGAARIVRGAGFVEEESKGRYLYNSKARWIDRVTAAFARKSKATGNTSMFQHGSKLYALMEASLAQEIDPETLESLGEVDFGVVRSAFSAHPKRVASLATSFNFGVRYEKEMWLDLYALPDEGPVQSIVSVVAPWMSMVHDFVVTENHIVLFIMPSKLVLWRALLGLGDIEKLFRWEPKLGAQVVVVPLSEPENFKRIELEPFWVWHFVNAFEAGGTIQVDACRYDEFSLSDIGETETDVNPTYHRLEIETASEKASWSQRGEHHVEFPQVHPSRGGLAHQCAFSIVRVDGTLGLGRTNARADVAGWFPDASHELSEPVLVPRSEAEDDVWVLSLLADREQGHSYLAVLDGQRLEEGPVARAHFEQTIPLTFHGTFVPSKSSLGG